MDLLPKEIISTVLCYVVCGDYEDECDEENKKPVDIAVCNSNGYLLEIFDKKIINSCYVLIEDASKIRIYYKFTEDSCKVYYLIINKSGVMIVVKKCNNTLLVVKCFKNVKDFKIFDYKNKGYPQIGINYFNSDKEEITELSEFDNIKLGKESDFSLDGKEISNILFSDISYNKEENEKTMEVDQLLHTEAGEKEDEEQDQAQSLKKEEDKSVIKEYLSKKLKGMENYQNELNYELENLNLMLTNRLQSEHVHPDATADNENPDANTDNENPDANTENENPDANTENENPDAYTENENPDANTEPTDKRINIESRRTWFRFHDGKWIIGIEFWRTGIRDIDDIKVLVRKHGFPYVTYRFFDLSVAETDIKSKTAAVTQEEDEASGTNPEDAQAIPDAQLKSLVVFVLEIPEFGDESKLSADFTFIYDTYQYHTQTYRLAVDELLRPQLNFFHDKNEVTLSEDVFACLTLYINLDVTVEMRYDLGLSMEHILSKNMGFMKAQILNTVYYVKESGHLAGTVITFKQLPGISMKWKFSMCVKDLPRLKIFIKALSSELPLPLRIRVDA